MFIKYKISRDMKYYSLRWVLYEKRKFLRLPYWKEIFSNCDEKFCVMVLKDLCKKDTYYTSHGDPL